MVFLDLSQNNHSNSFKVMKGCDTIQHDTYLNHETLIAIMVYFSDIGEQISGSVYMKVRQENRSLRLNQNTLLKRSNFSYQKPVKWHRKFLLQYLNMLVSNSYVLYTNVGGRNSDPVSINYVRLVKLLVHQFSVILCVARLRICHEWKAKITWT